VPTPANPATRDPVIDALRSLALLVVVFGHWIATLPRTEAGRFATADHLLAVWPAAGPLTWVMQVVPLFAMLSAAVSASSAERVLAPDHGLGAFWGARVLRLVRPALTYLVVLSLLSLVLLVAPGPILASFSGSVSVHLWFLVMLLAVQLGLPAAVAAQRRYGLVALATLVVGVVLVDLARALAGPEGLAHFGSAVMAGPALLGAPNALLVWLVAQQLGLAWRYGSLRGVRAGLALLGLGVAWLWVASASGYPTAMVGAGPTGSNVLPPSLALLGVLWVQAGLLLVGHRLLTRVVCWPPLARVFALLGVLGMPLYLWHKLAEPALVAGVSGLSSAVSAFDRGLPGDPGFWAGRLGWLLACSLVSLPILAAVVAVERRRAREVALTRSRWRIVAGGGAAMVGLALALVFGLGPWMLVASGLVAASSLLLRER
jgi:hypothetical protein